MMMMSSADEEAYRHFKETLEADLKQNIKPVIISLTMLAEDYKQSSQVIAKSIEEYILHVPADIKILGLYLMDSIMKNLKYNTDYTTIFESSIINLFIKVFECVDETNRKALYKLRQTWNEVFPNPVLYQIDVSVKRIDPAWPVTANNPNSSQPPSAMSRSSPNQTSSKSILLNQTNIITPSMTTILGQTQSISSNQTSTHKTASVTTTSGQTSSTSSLQTNKISQELNNKQQQQSNRTSPISVIKETNTTTTSSSNKKESDVVKRSTDDSLSSDSKVVRDPRLAHRKQQQPPQPQPQQQPQTNKPSTTIVKSNSHHELMETSPPQLKKKLLSNDINKQALKRSSPSSSSIQNLAQEIKKPKLTQNGEKVSPPSSNKTNLTSPKNVNKFNNSLSPSNAKSSLVNKISKLQNTEDIEIDTVKLAKVLNKIPKKDDRPTIKTLIEPVAPNKTKSLNEKVAQPTSDNNLQTTKAIPSLFDIQPTPNLNTQPVITKKTDTTTTSSPPTTTSVPKAKSFPANTKPSQHKSNKSITSSNTTTKTVKPLNTNNTTNNKKSVSDLKSNEIQQKQTNKTKQVQQTDDFIFGNEEDVDERFSNNNSITQQLKKLTDLVLTTNTTSNTKTQSNDLMSNLFDSNNKIKPNVLAILNASKQKQPPNNRSHQIDEINKSIDQLNEPNSKSNTQELIGAIKTLIKQLEQHQKQPPVVTTSQPPKKDASPLMTNESQPIDDQDLEDVNNNNDNGDNGDYQEDQENHYDESYEDDSMMNPNQTHNTTYYDQVVAYSDLPPIKPRDKTENLNDSLLIIDGRSYRIQPEVRRLIKVYYHDHELFCDTRTKEVFVDQKRVYKMGEPTKEIMLNGRRVRLMYMGKRIELWIDGLSYHFRADSPPKQISITSSQTNQIKRYYVTIDSRTMDMFFDNYKVCQINGGTHGSGPNKVMVQLAPNDFEYHEISFVCPPKRIMIDGVPRTMRYDLPVPCIEMENGVFYVIRFSGKPREIYIDDIPYLVPFDKTIRIKLNGRAHELAWGGPGFEVIIDGRPYELQFNKPSREIIIGTRPHFIYICGDAPDVKICGQLPYDLLNQQQSSHDEEIDSEPTKNIPPLMQSNNFTMQQQLMSQSTTTTSTNQPPNINELFNSLLAQGLIKPVPKVDQAPKLTSSIDSIVKNLFNTNTPSSSQQQENLNEKEIEKLPDLTNFDVDLLKKTYQGAIQSLYSGHQCATCGNRFNQNENGNNSRYRKHLDWHFRQNRKEKDEINKAHSRGWYYILQDWIQYEELSEDSANLANENDKQQANADSDDENGDLLHENGVSKNSISAYNHGTTCPATNDIDDKCYVCQDPFEIFFHDEKDEWHFKDAIRVDNRIYHPICYEDARDDQMSFQNTSMNRSISEENNNNNNNNLNEREMHVDQTNQEHASDSNGQNENKSTSSSSNDNRLKNEPRTP